MRPNAIRSTLSTFAFIVSSAALLAACSSVKLDEKPPVEEKPAKPVAQENTRAVQTVETQSVDPLNDPKGELAKRSVYFDFDSYVVKDEFQPLITAHGKYLNAHKERKIIIQGNTDERGGSEYNLALGQKRAEAVRKSLAVVGVPDSQMEAVSLGKEKPKAAGHDETSWTENRRADIVYQ
jgi:peptidoglycan-associated lipoprotein